MVKWVIFVIKNSELKAHDKQKHDVSEGIHVISIDYYLS